MTLTAQTVQNTMALNKKYKLSYGWRLFLPMVGLLWVVIISVAAYQYKNESEMRQDAINDQIRMLNSRIIAAYEQELDLMPVIQFVAKYYENSALNGIRVSVYDDKGNMIYCIGTPIPPSVNGKTAPEVIAANAVGHGVALRRSDIDPSQAYYYFGVRTSADGKIYVHTAMPYTSALSRELSVGNGIWIIILVLAVAATIFAYIATRILSRNVMLLHDFATKAATGEPLPKIESFPHNELGDISRQIYKLYTDKDAAMSRSEREHSIAIKATEDKIHMTRELSNNINHELKTPVGVIRGYLDTIATHPDMPQEMKQRFIENARNAMDRLCNLLNDLSSITRLEEGADTISNEAVDINDLLFNISTELKSINMINNITFSYDVPDDCIVAGNYNLLYGMMMNLIRNADFHSRGETCSVRLLAQNSKEYTFSFADDGVGVDEQHLPHLFDRFYRIDKGRSRKVGGTGLGLPIVKNTVTAFGGTIFARNRKPHGLEFVFTLLKVNNEHNSKPDSIKIG